jgi:hypothetical protein
MIAPRQQSSYHVGKKSTQKARRHYTSNTCSHTLDCQAKVISDRDPRFISKFMQEVCRITGIERNPSTAYHPRTDGQSERSNQWVETAIRFISDHHQTNWAPYLPIAQFAHNNWPSETTRKSPFFLLMGYHPRADWISSSSPLTTGHIAPRTAETGTRYGATTHDQGPTVMGQTP